MTKATALWQAFVCMTIHRQLKMIHASDDRYVHGGHIIICKICEAFEQSSEEKDVILTRWYFGRPVSMIPFLPLMFMVAWIHEKLTGREGSFEHPTEHRYPIR